MSEEKSETKESQYQHCVDLKEKKGLTPLGLMTSQAWNDDPKHLLFTASRYKFISKMLHGKKNVLEVGCADAFFTRIVAQGVEKVTATDFDPVFIEDVKERMDDAWPFECKVHDILSGPLEESFDAAYSMDVIEHINPEDEDHFMKNVTSSLSASGCAIIGSPSLESQKYASPLSKEGHVNCKTGATMRTLLENYFHNVFIFSMNDEVIHTGYHPMAHYVIGIGSTLKS